MTRIQQARARPALRLRTAEQHFFWGVFFTLMSKNCRLKFDRISSRESGPVSWMEMPMARGGDRVPTHDSVGPAPTVSEQ